METGGKMGIVGFIPWLKDLLPRSWLGIDAMEASVANVYRYFEVGLKITVAKMGLYTVTFNRLRALLKSIEKISIPMTFVILPTTFSTNNKKRTAETSRRLSPMISYSCRWAISSLLEEKRPV